MRHRSIAFATLFSLTAISPAHAIWGDTSYDPNPAMIDEDHNAQFDLVTLMTYAFGGSGDLSMARQNFESGFSRGQTLDNWVALGNNNVRFGFGHSIGSVQWKGVIGSVDSDATEYGLSHPHGTYGNAEGVLNQPRNYVVDLNYLSVPEGNPAPGYFVMQFQRPIALLVFGMIDYEQIGGTFGLTLWNGSDLDDLVEVPPGFNLERTVRDGQVPGGMEYMVAFGAHSSDDEFPAFNYAILRLDGYDGTVGFDNFFVGQYDVPEPGTLSLAALSLLGLTGLRRRKQSASARSSCSIPARTR